MPRKQSDEVLYTFCDVAACFSADEWKLLHEWQKELYNNVMKEIQQALTSLGPLIATSVFSLRPKEKVNVDRVTLQEVEIKGSFNSLSSNVTGDTELWFEEDQLLIDAQDTDGCCDGPRKESADIPPVISPCIKSEDGLYHSEQIDLERKEDIIIATEPQVTTPAAPIGINEEGETYAINVQDYQRSPAGCTDIPLVLSNCIKREDGVDSADQLLSERKEITSNATGCGGGGTAGTGNIGKCVKYKNMPRSFLASTKKGNKTLIQSSQLQSESDCKNSGEKSEQCLSGCNQLDHTKLNPTTTNVQMSDAFYKNQYNVPSKSDIQPGSRSYVSPESEQSCPLSVPGRCAREVKRRFACAECGKCVTRMASLIEHQRTHTGERPFFCGFCAKNFAHKSALQRHLRLHTSEVKSLFTCTDCGKCFPSIRTLIMHQKIHTRKAISF